MKDFLKRNKLIILSCSILIILVFSFVYTTSAYTYESLKTKSSLNIRCGPGTNYDRVGKLSDGDYINVFAKVGDWYIIQTVDNVVGAVSSKYIEAVYDENEMKNYTQLKSLQTVKEAESTQTSTLNQTEVQSIDNLELTQEEQEFLNLINFNRKNNGLEELKIDSTVQNIARLKAKDLENNHYFSHTSPTYGNIEAMLKSFDVAYIRVQENIAGNQNLSGAVEAWMNSDSHKSNILNGNFNYTGVAIVDSATYGKIFVEVFVQK